MAVGPDYCSLLQVQGRLYAGQGLAPGDPAPVDATRDVLLQELISNTSRDFDHEVEGPNLPGLFSPKYAVRVYSGQGAQILEVDPLLVLVKAEVNTTPGRTPTWTDYTGELSTYQMGLLPSIEGYPKHSVFRQASWYVDPFPLGNVRFTGVWGVCQPDPAMAQPATFFGLSPSAIQAVAPDPNSAVGWWVTPQDVSDAVAEWVIYRFEHSKAAYAEHPGPVNAPGTSDTLYPADIPADVARIIARYKEEDANHPKLALVGNEMDQVPSGYRWAGWLTQ